MTAAQSGPRFDPAAYGRVWAHDYDELYEDRDDLSEIVTVVKELAGNGSVLELGVGSGRLAVPLAAAGHAVTGVDASPEMLDLLRGRPGSAGIELIEGDFTTVATGRRHDVVLIAFSTLYLVPSQALQLEVLRNCARHLAPGGAVVVEAFVPDHSRWTRGQNLALGHLDDSGVTLKLSVHDAVNQVITQQDVTVGPDGTSLRPNLLRYIWPSELDALALAAGLRLGRRTEDWGGRPFTAASAAHVSVYVRDTER